MHPSWDIAMKLLGQFVVDPAFDERHLATCEQNVGDINVKTKIGM